jgi:DNA-binding MarR family transcriptional regulator
MINRHCRPEDHALPDARRVVMTRRQANRASQQTDAIKTSATYLLQVAARLQTMNFMERIADSGVHPAESYVLHELWQEAPLSQSELSRRLDIGNATVGQTLKRLERDGFVARDRNGDDKRVVMVRLTERGRRARLRFYHAAESQIAEVECLLGPADAKRFRALLTRLIAHFRKPAL